MKKGPRSSMSGLDYESRGEVRGSGDGHRYIFETARACVQRYVEHSTVPRDRPRE